MRVLRQFPVPGGFQAGPLGVVAVWGSVGSRRGGGPQVGVVPVQVHRHPVENTTSILRQT